MGRVDARERCRDALDIADGVRHRQPEVRIRDGRRTGFVGHDQLGRGNLFGEPDDRRAVGRRVVDELVEPVVQAVV